MTQQELKAKKEWKKLEAKLIINDIKKLNREIDMREKMIADLWELHKLKTTESQDIADSLLELEYKMLNEKGL